MSDITIPPEALEAAARAMAKAGYGFVGIELTDPYTADAEYWDTVGRAACLAMLKAWPFGAVCHYTIKDTEGWELVLPLPQEASDE